MLQRLNRILVLTLSLAVAPASVTWGQSEADWEDDWGDDSALPVELHGFVEAAGSGRLQEDPQAVDDYLLGEARFRLDLAHYGAQSELAFKGDLLYDAVRDETRVDIRQAWIALRTGDAFDWRVGRQVLTWGTGDLVFLNDLFPKDFQSFFIGRDDEFLKAPSNTLKASVYSSVANLDVTWTPVFTPDITIDGSILSFTDPRTGEPTGPDSPDTPVVAGEPRRTWGNGEWAARLHRPFGSIEAAAYGYLGRFKQPTAWDPHAMHATYARMASGGASLRGNLLGGVANFEGTWYGSLDDPDGTNPLIPNSEARGLVGYERELVRRWSLGLQVYLEWLQHHDRLVAQLPASSVVPPETRQWGTLRLTGRLMQQTLTLSLFGFVDLERGDTHWRPSISRDWTDNVQVTAGANVMTGDTDTFFGQLENNTNAYLRVRYSM